MPVQEVVVEEEVQPKQPVILPRPELWTVGVGPGCYMDGRDEECSDYGGERIGGCYNFIWDEYFKNNGKKM